MNIYLNYNRLCAYMYMINRMYVMYTCTGTQLPVQLCSCSCTCSVIIHNTYRTYRYQVPVSCKTVHMYVSHCLLAIPCVLASWELQPWHLAFPSRELVGEVSFPFAPVINQWHPYHQSIVPPSSHYQPVARP